MVDCAVVELRQYTLKPGSRDTLIALFDLSFVESQEATGMRIIGQFRDLDDPDRFVWLRGFADMTARHAALAAFYGGPVWAEHRDAARATMVDTDDALLLRPARGGAGFDLAEPRPAVGATTSPDGLVIGAVHHLTEPLSPDGVATVEAALAGRLAEAGLSLLGSFVTEPGENTFAPLPVRAGEDVYVWFARGRERAVSREWLGSATLDLPLDERAPPQRLRLAPTPRSQLR